MADRTDILVLEYMEMEYIDTNWLHVGSDPTPGGGGRWHVSFNALVTCSAGARAGRTVVSACATAELFEAHRGTGFVAKLGVAW